MKSRVAAIFCILGLVVGGLVVDSTQSRPEQRPPVVGNTNSTPTSAAWFCAATATEGSIVVRNSGNSASATASFASRDGRRETSTFEIPSNSQAIVRPADVFSADLVATSINSSSTELSVSHQFDGDAPVAICPRRASTDLTFVDNQTLGTSPMTLVLYNPFPDDAVVNVTFDTELGPTDPDTFDGVVVAPRSVVVLDVAGELRRREWVTSNIKVRRGRVVAEALQGQSDVDGLNLSSPIVAQREWNFDPAQVAVDGASRVSVFNPSDREIGVTANIANTPAAVIPFTLRVPSRGRVVIDLNAEERVPKDAPIGVAVTSEDNTEVIARRF